jgi:hypothetical protein
MQTLSRFFDLLTCVELTLLRLAEFFAFVFGLFHYVKWLVRSKQV